MIRPNTRRPAFTRIDLTVAVALAAASLGVVLPGVRQLRAAADRTTCADHLRVIGGGAREYAAAHNGDLPRDRIQPPRGGWNTEVLSYIGEEKLARAYSEQKDWWDTGNRAAAGTVVPAFLCPAAPHPARRVLTADPDDAAKSFPAAPSDYVGSAGAYYQDNQPKNLHAGAMQHRVITRRIRTSDIQDGTAYTLLVVEMADKPNGWQAGVLTDDRSDKPQMPALAGQWAAPNWNHLRSHSADGKTSFGPCAVNCSNGAAIYGFHPGGANGLFVDGSVRFLKAGMSQEMLIALVSIAGGELLSPNDF